MKLVNNKIEHAVLKIKYAEANSVILTPNYAHLWRSLQDILQTVILNISVK